MADYTMKSKAEDDCKLLSRLKVKTHKMQMIYVHTVQNLAKR